jgi:hypothetical protein
MERRHQDALTNRLEEALLNGVSHITWEELYLWYDVKKIAARTYRDLNERWRTLSDGEKGPLMKVEGRGGIFVHGEGASSRVDANNIADDL